MASHTYIISAVLLTLLTFAFASSQSLDVYYWPLNSSAQPDRLLTVTLNAAASDATITSYAPPTQEALSGANELARIGTFDPVSNEWIGTLVRRSIFESGQSLDLQLHVDPSSSHVYGVSLRTSLSSKAGDNKAFPGVKIIPPSPYLAPVLSQPAPIVRDGTPAVQVPEKTFIQK